MRLHVRNSVTKAKRELGAQFEAMLHENTVEVEEDNVEATSDLLSSQLAMLEVSSLPNSPILRQSHESMLSEKNGAANTQILVQNDSGAMDTLNTNMLQPTMLLHKDPSRQSSLQKKLAMMQQKTSGDDINNSNNNSRHQSSVDSNSADRYQTFTAKARVKASTGKGTKTKAQAAQLASAATVNDNKRNITFKEWTVSMFKQERHSLGTNVDQLVAKMQKMTEQAKREF